eukprot:Lithocolla_globosa_v1_NODE_4824_length_1358_cov_9.409823.p1 type:complete len:358 gc:universal NODE_4824_length_1358_cov_9.409823:106-1179(+)
MDIHSTIFTEHAGIKVKLHAVYACIYLGYPQKVVAFVFGKSEATISRWITHYDDGSLLAEANKTEKDDKSSKKITLQHEQWLVTYTKKRPLSYLREIKRAFRKAHNFAVGTTSVYRILVNHGFTNKVIERRALEISLEEIARFTYEINQIKPLWFQLCFLDEFSTDSRAMLRKRGWFLRGRRPVYRSLFRRGTRLSCLCFLGALGIVDFFRTAGTFDRLHFFHCVRKLIDSGRVEKFPGLNSVWIMDGASIHVDAAMIDYIQSRGIKVIFLPAYCPFYNPIEIIFHHVKQRCRELYSPEKHGSEEVVLHKVLKEWKFHPVTNYFRQCGYQASGLFNPHTNHDLIMKEIEIICDPVSE